MLPPHWLPRSEGDRGEDVPSRSTGDGGRGAWSGRIAAALVARGAGGWPMKAVGEKEGGTRFSQCALGSVKCGFRLGYVNFRLASQSMDRLKRVSGFLRVSL